MKKLLLIILSILSLFIFTTNQSLALELQLSDFTPTIDKIVAKKKTTEEKVKFLQTFSDMLAQPTFTQDKKAWLFEQIRNYTLNMLNVFQHELKEEQTSKTYNSSTKTSSTKTSSDTTTIKK